MENENKLPVLLYDDNLQSTREIAKLFDDVQATNTDGIVKSIVPSGFPPSTRKSGELDPDDMYFFKVERLSFDDEIPRREAMENVVMSLGNEAFNFVYVLTGNENGKVDMHIGVVANQNKNSDSSLTTAKFGGDIENAFNGNFNGSKLERLRDEALTEFASKSVSKYTDAGIITGIPSINEKDAGDKSDFQGVDRLINSMLGKKWRLTVVCEPISKDEIGEIYENVYEVYNYLSRYAKINWQHSENDSKADAFGKSKTETDGRSKTIGANESKGGNSGWSHGRESQTSGGTNWSKGTNSSATENWSKAKGKTWNRTITQGKSDALTVEFVNKRASETMKYIDEELLERLKLGRAKGLYRTSVYYMATNPADADQLKSSVIALFQGNKSTFSPLNAHKLEMPENDAEKMALGKKIMRTYQNHQMRMPDANAYALSLHSRPFGIDGGESVIGLSTYLTAKEVSLFAGLPMKEVAGLPIKESVDFGLNEKEIDGGDKDKIEIGKMIQKGREMENLPFYLARKSMDKHTFIAGVTGSGKTNTCYILLQEADMPFMVIEPAKTEYRSLLNYHADIIVFTLGNEQVAPFRINPFEVIKGENISSHIDMVKATFTSAFPMEASMPQLLEEAIIKSYEDKGWDINSNTNDKYGDKAYSTEVDAFPVLSDLLAAMPVVVKEKNFGDKMGSEYIGSLVSRLSNLTKGSKGAMLDTPHSVDFRFLLKNKVIIEMEDVKSPEDKALLMGFILTKMTETIKCVFKETQKKNIGKLDSEKIPRFQHLTLIEEAHRLLTKVDYGDSGARKSAVETFADLLAEVRKYGEGLIVVDQIPNKLAPEVLKNTNTKIIHKILAKDDKEAVGDTMLMDDKQKEFLSALDVGEAVVFNEHTSKPIHIKVKEADEKDKETSDELLKERFEKKVKDKMGNCYDNLDMMKAMGFFKQIIYYLCKDKNPNKEDCDSFVASLQKVATKKTNSKEKILREVIETYDKRFVENLPKRINTKECRINSLYDFFSTNVLQADSVDATAMLDIFNEKKLWECCRG